MTAPIFKPEWRTQNRFKRRIYAKYMTWLERSGYVLVVLLLSMFVGSFFYYVDDFVTAEATPITASSTSIAASEETLVVKLLHKDFDDVAKGAGLMEVVKGADAIKRYQAWAALAEAKAPAVPAKPATETVTSTGEGCVRLTVAEGDRIATGKELARVVNYDELEAKGTFKGETVGRAGKGQTARISGLAINMGETVFRGDSAEGILYSRSILGDSVQKALQTALAGKDVTVRDDAPLRVSEVTGVEIDASVEASATKDHVATLDPQAGTTLKGTVIDGVQKAEVQIANLPADVQSEAAKALSSAIVGRKLEEPEGGALEVKGLTNPRFVVKAKATISDAGVKGISASPLSRSFAGTVRLENAPAYLREKVREADRLGKTVTAKVEIRTGDRPIAFILLRRS